MMKVICAKLIDINKGDKERPNINCRLVGRELAIEKRDDLFAVTPPLETFKAVISVCSSNQKRARPFRILSIDVKRAYLYAPATRPIFIKIQMEVRHPGDEGFVAQLNLCLYGTKDAAQNCTNTYTQFLTSVGFKTGKGCTCDFHNVGTNISMTCHERTSRLPDQLLIWNG